MKFGKQIRFVAVKQWYDHYFPYKELKKLIKQYLFRIQETSELVTNPEELEETRKRCVDEFLASVNENVNHVVTFFVEQYLEIENSTQGIKLDLDDYLDSGIGRDEDTDKRFHKRIYGEMLTLYELRTFLEVNRTGAQKIIKKFARLFQMPQVKLDYESADQEIFSNLPSINDLMRSLEDLFVTIKREIAVEANNKSRPDIIMELHASVENALIWKQSTVLAKFEAMTFRHNELLLKPTPVKVVPIIIAFIVLLVFQFKQFTPKLEFTAQRCIGIVGFAGILWATSAVPLWLASMSVPLLGIVCDLLPYPYATVGKAMQQATMSPTVFLTMGGFTIAAALRETEMDKRIATVVLQKASTNRRVFLLALILLNAFIACWISNITSTMIVITLVAPTLAQIPTASQYAKAVLFSIAVGGNLGGMMTPLSSPQNAVTVDSVATVAHEHGLTDQISFVEFFATALPFSVICCVLSWVVVQIRFKMDLDIVPPVPAVKTDFGWRQIVVCIVSLGTIGVWISLPFGGNKIFSDFGIVGLIPMLLFYGTGILPPTRLADLPWNIIFLLLGGNALCKVVTDSGLMYVVADLMKALLGDFNLWVSILVVNICVLVIDFFLTHTVSSMITLPLVCNFAATSGHLRLYAMSACMITTASQILPVSSFPNMCTVQLQDSNGRYYITTNEMICWGILITVVCLIACLSIYYGIALAYGM